jgi:RNA polymerase sigma-70 factor (ECF subfamily)
VRERAAAEFDEFYRSTSGRLVRYVFGLTGDLADAQDLVQETYVRAWRHWDRLTGYESAEAWLRMVATRLATDRWRRLGVRRAFLAAAPPGGVVPPPSEETVLVVTALRSLPTAQRRAVVMHYLLDLPVAEIARETGVAVGTVKSWLSRARSALLAELAPAPAANGGDRNV